MKSAAVTEDFPDDDSKKLIASLGYTRLTTVNETVLVETAPWISACLADAVSALPFGVVIDLVILFTKPQINYHESTVLLDEMQLALRNYEDDFLRRIVSSAHFIAVRDLLHRLPEQEKLAAVAYLIHQILTAIGIRFELQVNLSVARALLDKFGPGIVSQLQSAALEKQAYDRLFARDYQKIARLARHTSDLLTAHDLLVVENIATLKNLTQRVKFIQVVKAAELLGQSLPLRLGSDRQASGVVATRLEDDNDYPVGGFNSISNSGVMENLVSSELIYMENSQEFDLFDLRYSEGDLLYYLRDENVLYRSRREYTFILDGSLSQARVKHSRLPYQDIVLVFAILLCVLRRLTQWISDDELKITLCFPTEQDVQLGSEKKQSFLLFREWIDNGSLAIESGCDNGSESPNKVVLCYNRSDEEMQKGRVNLNVVNHMPVVTTDKTANIFLQQTDREEMLEADFQNWVAATDKLLRLLC